MALRIVLMLLGLGQLANGLFMLLAPAQWFVTIPGVSATGPYNEHLVLDVAFAYIASGIAVALAIRSGRTFATIALVGSVWPALHAVLHISEWMRNGIPPADAFATAAIGVVGISVLSLALAILNVRSAESERALAT